jgi:hypothetical protein
LTAGTASLTNLTVNQPVSLNTPAQGLRNNTFGRLIQFRGSVTNATSAVINIDQLLRDTLVLSGYTTQGILALLTVFESGTAFRYTNTLMGWLKSGRAPNFWGYRDTGGFTVSGVLISNAFSGMPFSNLLSKVTYNWCLTLIMDGYEEPTT